MSVAKGLFQSTPPVKAATIDLAYPSILRAFQSTPPVKAATGLINGRLSSESISIHAAREGGDVQPAKEFAPEQISIHAAREGGDTTARIFSKLNENFNPRRP